MKKAILTAIIVSAFLISLIAEIPIVSAQLQQNITIKADGSIDPSTAPIQQTGNTVILTSGLLGSITIQRNNIVFDGNGHTLTGNGIDAQITSSADTVLSISSAFNVTVKNLTIRNSPIGINLRETSNITIINNTITQMGTSLPGLEPTAGIEVDDGSSNIITGNSFVNNQVGITLTSWNSGRCSNNLIYGNNFTGCSIVFLLYDSSNNSIYYNNFINDTNTVEDTGYEGYGIVSLNVWDYGYCGNYWSDYLTKYPNATEIGSSGVGNTPYFIKPSNFIAPSYEMGSQARNYWIRLNTLYLNNTDYYPLMVPCYIEDNAVLLSTPSPIPILFPNLPLIPTPSPSLSPSSSPTPSLTPSGSPTQQPTIEPSPTAHNNQAENFTPTIIILSLVAVAAVIGVLVYFAKHKRLK